MMAVTIIAAEQADHGTKSCHTQVDYHGCRSAFSSTIQAVPHGLKKTFYSEETRWDLDNPVPLTKYAALPLLRTYLPTDCLWLKS